MTDSSEPRTAGIDQVRATFAAIADVLLPAAEGMPSASEVKAHERWLDRVIAARPDLEAPLVGILSRAADRDPAAEVDRLADDDPESLELILFVATAAYYMHPKVRKRLGYPGQRARPPAPDEAEYFLRDDILQPVIDRGPIYRSVPK